MPKEDADQIVKKLHAHGGDLHADGTVTVGPDWHVAVPEYPKKRPPFEAHKEEPMSTEVDEEIELTKKQRAALVEKPVENAGPVPLMPNLDANARHVIVKIRVTKRTPPGDGIKGEVADSTTAEFIAQRWGDGIYDFDALNEGGQVLRRNHNIKLSFGYAPIGDPSMVSPLQKLMTGSGGNDDKLYERLDKESQRAHDAALAAVASAKEQSQSYAQMVREDSKERAEKDRTYHKAQTEQQTGFFQSMIVSMQTMHEQAMERSREQFQQTMQMMQFSHQQTMAQNNPALMLQLFERGMSMGRDLDSGGEESPLSAILGAAAHGLSTVKDMMLLQQNPQPAMLPTGMPAAPAAAKKNPDKKRPLSNEEITEILKLKKIAEAKGLPFGGLVKQAQVMVSNMPAEDPPDTEEDEDEDDEEEPGDDEESSGSSDVG